MMQKKKNSQHKTETETLSRSVKSRAVVSLSFAFDSLFYCSVTSLFNFARMALYVINTFMVKQIIDE